MGLFNRKNKNAQADGGSSGDSSADAKKEKGGWRRPANTAFKQQRLKAWQPILTPKTVLPTFFILGVLFAIIGGLLIWGSGQVTELTIDYTHCDEQTPATSTTDSGAFHDVSSYSYRLSADQTSASYNPPKYAYIQSTTNSCAIQFDVPYDIGPKVLLYYRLSNFFQNHRRYVKSLDSDQLQGKSRSAGDLNKTGDCKPLATDSNGKVIYPCGLIANSQFNDTIDTSLAAVDAGQAYTFSKSGIAWPGEAKKYSNQPGYSDLTNIVPPPNWASRYPNGYNSSNLPKLADDQDFQNWMRTAGLPTFAKLYGRNDADTLRKGRYQINIGLNFPVKPYNGTKSLVISTVSWIGGKNPFLGWAYVAAAALFFLLGVLGTIRHLVKPRQLGDMSLLSWNR